MSDQWGQTSQQGQSAQWDQQPQRSSTWQQPEPFPATFQQWQPEPFPQPPVQQPPQGKIYISKKIILLSILIFVVILASITGVFIWLLPRPQPQPPRKVDITVNFGNRQSVAHPINKAMFGLGYGGFSTQFNSVSSYLPKAGLMALRSPIEFANIFPTLASATDPSQQVWTTLDDFINTAQSLGAHPIILLNDSPPWLQPQVQNAHLTNPCSVIHESPSHVKPVYLVNGVDQGEQHWGELAAQVVAHMDHTFPNVNPDYEIWNEPDGITFLCAPGNNLVAEQTRLAQYKAIYAAAAPLMKQQAQQDQRQISIGGPTLAVPARDANMWLKAFVDDPSLAPYIDFISYHDYISGKATDTWKQLLAETQDPNSGAAAVFEKVSAIVRAGRQPNAQSTPIYIDEYNTNTKLADCCRNSPTYAPLWNAVFVSDLFNSVLKPHTRNTAAQTVPARLLYFTANRQEIQFCMFGTIDANMDCALGPDIQPYPQYYTYQLLSDPTFLGLDNGGYVVNAPTIAPSTKVAGLLMTDFYTPQKDNMLIVNTGGQSYQQLNIAVRDTGSVQTGASVFTLNQNNPHISTQQVSLSSASNGYTVAIDIPAYSVVALSLNAAS